MLARTIVVLACLSLLAQRRAQAAPMFHYSWNHVPGPRLGTREEQRAPSHHFVASHEPLSPEDLAFVNNVLSDSDPPMHPSEGSKVSSEESFAHARQKIPRDLVKSTQGIAHDVSIDKLTKERNRINSQYFKNTIIWLNDEQTMDTVRGQWRERAPFRRPSHQLPSLENFLGSGKRSELYMTQHNIHTTLPADAPLGGHPYLMLWGKTQTRTSKIKLVHIGTGFVEKKNKDAAEAALRKALSELPSLARAHV
ncbi:hypothetical protein sr13375 [Sporisorium reilianum SRZ2]|uniref:Effector family protein Eff1 n=1 Tax=Sporisorium reilianum (strain SRZ2) TaxID=999809 RepID=E6ZZM5_SPORE|nr:hypothetical protein sr13375 [Sporisorium reilianum SRZ2]